MKLALAALPARGPGVSRDDHVHDPASLVAGDSHRNRITPYPRPSDGGFWEVVTAAHTDWPQQSRMLELVDNLDGSLSLFTSVFEHSAPPRPPRVRPTRNGRLSAGES